MKYELRIDIEQVDPDGVCGSSVDEVLLAESEEARVIDKGMETIRGIFPLKDCDGINAAGLNAKAIIYTVYVYKRDEEGNTEYYEELDLAGFTNLKKAKQLMREVIDNFKS